MQVGIVVEYDAAVAALRLSPMFTNTKKYYSKIVAYFLGISSSGVAAVSLGAIIKDMLLQEKRRGGSSLYISSRHFNNFSIIKKRTKINKVKFLDSKGIRLLPFHQEVKIYSTRLYVTSILLLWNKCELQEPTPPEKKKWLLCCSPTTSTEFDLSL